MLLLARNRRRKTQTQLAAESGVAQAAISRIENGTRDALSLEEIQAIARVLRFPVSFFYEQEPHYRIPLSLHGAAFRKRASVSAKEQHAVVALANHFALQFRRLLDAIDIEPQYPLLQFEVLSNKSSVSEHALAVSSPNEAAQKVRASWQLGDGPMTNLVQYVEATGVLVVEGDFGETDVDGLTLRPPGMRPIVLLNRNRPADRKRFSLAHEYGHVVLHPFPYDAMEKEANEFAAELLMPRAGIIPDLAQVITIPRLGRLKQKWRVAMSALIYRAKTLGTISDEAATNLYKIMNMHGYRKREPIEFDIAPDAGKLASQLVALHLSDLGYSLEELAAALRTEPEEFAEMHGLLAPSTSAAGKSKPKLQLVVNRD
ncbi:XRE family transcriptional regulator [Xanthobacter aminoxidans]|uniref:XRE family transcriptional regulator n=2 Tax=Xanthobacter TaxID=279 RepID=UPI002022DB0A|nr:XRE family transcriptional regulator [Xanthobacter aminoxidans]MCL8384668.1 XRE family transcriptional regulator [Xanthobacter aminoxidans]